MSKSRKVPQAEAFVIALQFEERMMLSMLLLQSEGNAAMLGIVRKFREKLSPNEREQEALGLFEAPGGRTGWNAKADKPVKFPMGPSLKGLIVMLLKKADAAKGLNLAQLSLYEKFVGKAEENPDESPSE